MNTHIFNKPLELSPHHPAELPRLLLPRALDRETVQVLAGVARELAARKDHGVAAAQIDGAFLAIWTEETHDRGVTFNALVRLAAMAIEQANLHAQAAEIAADPMSGIETAPSTPRLSRPQLRALRNAAARPEGNLCPFWPSVDDNPVSSQLLLDALERKGLIHYPRPGYPVINAAGRAAVAAHAVEVGAR